MKILVCGGRHFKDRTQLHTLLNLLHSRRPITLVIHGGARGADQMAESWALNCGVPRRCYLPQWGKHDRGAGPRRNERMLHEGEPVLCVAMPGGPGTKDMLERCERIGIPILRDPEEIGFVLESMDVRQGVY